MIDIQNMPEAMKRLKELLPLVPIQPHSLREAAEAIIEMQLEQMTHFDLAEYYYEMRMVEYRSNPTNLQCEMEYFVDIFDDPEIDNDIIIPFKD